MAPLRFEQWKQHVTATQAPPAFIAWLIQVGPLWIAVLENLVAGLRTPERSHKGQLEERRGSRVRGWRDTLVLPPPGSLAPTERGPQ